MSDTDGGSRTGSQLGPYHLRRLIGRGGFGEVYEAEDTVKDRVVALKLLKEAYSSDPVFRARLQREARSAGRLQEPHVVPIHDYGEIDGLLYVDMRLIDGTDLYAILKRYGPLSPARAVAIVRQIASALDAAHAAGVTHRDVKPENILVTRDDFAYLVDFGIANAVTDEKLTQLGTAVGTFAYMAPERFGNEEVTYRADIYSLACVLHECLTGSRPYRADSVSALVSAHLMSPVPRPSQLRPGIPSAFDEVISRGMAKNPNDRYATAGDLALAAQNALTSVDQDHADSIVNRSKEATLLTASGADAGTTATIRPPTHPPPPRQHTPTPQSMAPTQQAPGPPNAAAMGSGPLPAAGMGSGPLPAAGGYGTTPPGGYNTTPPGGYGTTPPGGYGAIPPGGYGTTPSPFMTGPTPTPAKRNNVPLIAGAIGGVVLLVVGAVVIWLLVKPSPTPVHGNNATGTATSTTATPSTTPASVAQFNPALLSYAEGIGYRSSDCSPVDPESPAVGEMDCNSISRGPDSARFWIYSSVTDLNTGFDDVLRQHSNETCPGGAQSPGTWHYDKNPDQNAGQLACGTFQGQASVVWTDETKLVLGSVKGSDLPTLYGWWKKPV